MPGTALKRCSLLLLVFAWLGATASQAFAGTTVFAAASLTDVMPALAARHVALGGALVRFSFASSSTLARQIENGAEADLFISADQEWMDYLEQRQLLVAGTRRNVAGNQLVLVAPADSPVAVQALAQASPLAQWLGSTGRLAVGDPAHVPVGRYARASLESLGLWSALAGRLAPADSTRTALKYVASGECPLGIVYRSDLYRADGVKVIGMFAPDTHPVIAYPAAVMAGRDTGDATRFMAFMASPEAAEVWKQFGFEPPAP